MTHYPQNLCGVGRNGNVGIGVPMFDCWADLGNLGGWTLRSLAIAPNGWKYGVGTAGNVGVWTLKMLAFDSLGRKYGVGTDGNVGRWVDTQWVDSGYNGWTLDMLAFDNSGDAWCVGTQGNVGGWTNGGWYNIKGYPGGWDMAWLLFAPITA